MPVSSFFFLFFFWLTELGCSESLTSAFSGSLIPYLLELETWPFLYYPALSTGQLVSYPARQLENHGETV